MCVNEDVYKGFPSRLYRSWCSHSLECCLLSCLFVCLFIPRYKLHFQHESAEEIERRKKRAQREPLTPVPEVCVKTGGLHSTHTHTYTHTHTHTHVFCSSLLRKERIVCQSLVFLSPYCYMYMCTYQIVMEVSVEDVYRPGSELDIPHRPPWSYSMTKQQLDRQEEAAFQDYLSQIHSSHNPHELSLFEHNLEVLCHVTVCHQSTSLTYSERIFIC